MRAWCPVFKLVPGEGDLRPVVAVWKDLEGLLTRLGFEADDGYTLEWRVRDESEGFQVNFLSLVLYQGKELGYSKLISLSPPEEC